MNHYIKMGLDLNLISIDDVKKHTTLELIFLIIEKINELTDGVNHLEVNAESIIREMLDDEMIANIIQSSVIPAIDHNAIDVKSYGVKGDGETDDTKAIQSLFDSLTVPSNSNSIPNGTVKVKFPTGVYHISEPIKIKGSMQIECSGAIIKAIKPMDVMMTIETTTQICGLEINNLILNGSGVAKTGLKLIDVYLTKINNPIIYACKENCLYASIHDGNTHICEVEVNGGLMLGGRHMASGGLTTCDDANGLHIHTTDSVFRNIYTVDFKTHIYNHSGVNFYDHCHGWNMCSELMQGSVHFKSDWDINCIGCYTDTIQTAFEFTGDGRGLITNHEVFVNASFYQSATYGAVEVIKASCETKGNSVIFNSCRFDRNGQEAIISSTESKLTNVKFDNVINDFETTSLIVSAYQGMANAASGEKGTVWASKIYKTDKNHVEMMLSGDVTQANLTSGGQLHLATLPANTFNTFYQMPIQVIITEYDSNKGCVLAGYITTDGKILCYAGELPFTCTNSCQWNVVTSYYIQY